jgi:predicted RNase H-like HicB family nuclease
MLARIAWKAEHGMMKYRVIIETDEDGRYCASVPALPGCRSDGKTRDDALTNITEAIEAYLESLVKAGAPIPLPVEEAFVDIDVARIDGAA